MQDELSAHTSTQLNVRPLLKLGYLSCLRVKYSAMPIMVPMAMNSKLPCTNPKIMNVTLEEKALTYIHHVMDMQSSARRLNINLKLWLLVIRYPERIENHIPQTGLRNDPAEATIQALEAVNPAIRL